jgi:hypothetical protein
MKSSANDLRWIVESKEFKNIAREGDIETIQLQVELCMECGQTHTTHKLCLNKRANQPRRYRAHAELRGKDDEEALEYVLRMNGYENVTCLVRALCDSVLGNTKDGVREFIIEI